MIKQHMVVVAALLLTSAPWCFAQKTSSGSQPAPPAVKKNDLEETKVVMFQVGGVPIPPAFADALQPVELPAGEGSWVIQVITRGGLTGGGRGDLTITSQGSVSCQPAEAACGKKLSGEALQPLSQLVILTQPSRWSESTLGVCHDCYMTLLALHRREAGGEKRMWIAYWDETTQRRVPAKVMRIYEAAVALKR